MGDKITFGDSLVVTVFSMTVVFVGLIILAVIISLLKNISVDKKIKGTEIEVPIVPKQQAKEEKVQPSVDDNELVAVIAAAIAASMGVKVPDINIKAIRRLPQNTPAWAQMGKQERIFGKL
ncbi:MAG: OadG family protein [Tissierellaceae bacterium]|nr:OadG family protein [Tissierellaceae bacterium]